ncbi:MAG: iron-sulfur cluster carrier protein ApbC [Bacteroidales bacterium]|nr:MAG: iron-sulfur cluster carrier protein ApbC [Bacteroidales bacterium]
MEISSNSVLEVLKQVLHPEHGKDIVNLGMVQKLLANDNKIDFTLTFTKVNDPFASSIKKACTRAIEEKFGKDIVLEIKIKANVAPKVESPYKAKASVSRVKNIIAIASGKGGVGKSTISANLAVAVARTGAKVGLIDADIFGPTIPKMFNVEGVQPVMIKEDGMDLIEPVKSFGVKVLSIGFFVQPDNALIWRGPMATSALKQLIHQGAWGDLDYLFIDLPPGTSDIHLTMVQEIKVTGAVIVSTPQDVALSAAIRGVSMFTSESIKIPILGFVENMAWFTPEELPNNKYYIFGKDGCKKLAERMKLPLLGQIPIVQGIREGGDNGNPAALGEGIMAKAFEQLAKNVISQVEIRNQTLPPTNKVEVKQKV